MTGYNQIMQWKVGSGDFTAFDRHTGEATPGGGEWSEAFGAGGAVVEWLTMIEPEGSADTTLQTGSLLSRLWPGAVGQLPPALTIQAGVVGDENGAVEWTDAYLTSLELSLEENGVVSANYRWKALGVAPVEITTPAQPPADLPFPWHGSSCTIEGASYRVRSWTVRLEHDIQLRTDLDAKPAGRARMPVWADPGVWRSTLTATLRIPPDLSPLEDCGATFSAAFAVRDCGATPRTLSVTLTNFRLDNLTRTIVEGGELVEYELSGHGAPNDLGATSISIT